MALISSLQELYYLAGCVNKMKDFRKSVNLETYLRDSIVAVSQLNTKAHIKSSWYLDSGFMQDLITELNRLDPKTPVDEANLRDGLHLLQNIGYHMNGGEAHFSLFSLGLADWLWFKAGTLDQEDPIGGLYRETFFTFCCFEEIMCPFVALSHRYVLIKYCRGSIKSMLEGFDDLPLYEFCLEYLLRLMCAYTRSDCELENDLIDNLKLIVQVLEPVDHNSSFVTFRDEQLLVTSIQFLQQCMHGPKMVLLSNLPSLCEKLWVNISEIIKHPRTGDTAKGQAIYFTKDFGSFYDISDSQELLQHISLYLVKLLDSFSPDQFDRHMIRNDDVSVMLLSFLQLYKQVKLFHPRFKLSWIHQFMMSSFVSFYDSNSATISFSENFVYAIDSFRELLADSDRRGSKRLSGVFNSGLGKADKVLHITQILHLK